MIKSFTAGFHRTPLWHLSIDSHNASYPMISLFDFIYCFFISIHVLAERGLYKSLRHHAWCCSTQMVRISVPCINDQINIHYVFAYKSNVNTIGENLFALLALLLLTLPDEFTFQVLLALPRLAERKRTF